MNELLAQERHSKNKFFSIHAPEVEYISKGKAQKRYKLGNKMGLVSTYSKNWIIDIKSYRGHNFNLSAQVETNLLNLIRFFGLHFS